MSSDNLTPLPLTVKVKDTRYQVTVDIDGVENFPLFFNPGDPYIIQYADAMRTLDYPANTDFDAMIAFANALEENFDAIFGKGAARKVFRYDGPDHALMNAVIDRMMQGYNDFNERNKEASKAAKTQAIIDAKKEGAAYSVPK